MTHASATPAGSLATVPGGYFGQALVVDVGSGEAERFELPEAILRACIGGAGLGSWLMHRLAPPGVDPLAPEAPLAFVFSPLVGTPLTTSAKFAVVAKSPLTGLLNDALASSHFAIAGKLTGNDAIVVRGACAEPSVLIVDGDGARIEPAADLWGLPAAAAETRLRERLGPGLARGRDRPRRGAAREVRDGVARRPPRRPRRPRRRAGREEHQGRRRPRDEYVLDPPVARQRCDVRLHLPVVVVRQAERTAVREPGETAQPRDLHVERNELHARTQLAQHLLVREIRGIVDERAQVDAMPARRDGAAR